MVKVESLILEIIFVQRQYFIFKHLKTKKKQSEGKILLKEEGVHYGLFFFSSGIIRRLSPQSPMINL